MNRILIKLYVPMIEEQYDIWIPLNKNIYNIIIILSQAINELNRGYYQPKEIPILYNRANGKIYDLKIKIIDTDIRSGTELVLI